jgi:hypothetical protein
MLIVPILLGIAASRPSAWHLVLLGAALAAYLLSATSQAWTRARRDPGYRAPLAVYAAGFGVLGLILVVVSPALLLVLVVGIPATAVVAVGARPGTRRDLVNSLAQVAQALALVPATAWVSGSFAIGPVVAMTGVAFVSLAGSVLAVRSVLAERGNDGFAALSAGFHIAATAASFVLLPLPYTAVAAILAGRAIALPIAQRRMAGTARPLRPIHVGVIEILASIAVVATAFGVPA